MPGRSLERILRLLKDGQWHDINEITNRTRLSPLKMRIITAFLAKYNFVQLDRKSARIKISRHIAKFFHAISSVDSEKTVKPTKER